MCNFAPFLREGKSKLGESRWTFNAVGEFSNERNHRVLSVPCFSSSHLPRRPYVLHALHVQEALCWYPGRKSIPDSITDELKDTLSLLFAHGPDSHSLLSVGFFFRLTRRTMNENCGLLFQLVTSYKYLMLILICWSFVLMHMGQ